ncbi:MAG: DUF4325 domain-containing protein [Candidatus Pacebacteria bacterium]|nr:DUF4325 domain-containing protein [Candidatus Paceibacterota bacterium]
MKIELKKFGAVLTSRPAGKEALAAFEPTLRRLNKKEDVIVDFDGVLVFSPSWGDEFLTPLLSRYKKGLKLINTSNISVIETVEMLEEVHGFKFNKIKI